MGNASGQDVVECRDAVGGDEQQLLVVDVVDVANLAAGVKVEIGEVGSQENGIEKFGAHDEILQVRGEAYSSWSENFVNDSDHPARSTAYPFGGKELTG